MPVHVIASTNGTAFSNAWEHASKKINERRAVYENTRSMNAKRIQNDIRRIAKKEIKFVQKLVQEIVPVRVTWNVDALEKLQDALPVQFDFISQYNDEQDVE